MFKFWSNVFYVIPLYLALHYFLLPTALFTFAVILLGVLYHFSNEKKYYHLDNASALLLIATNLQLCYRGHFKAPYFWIALLFLILAFIYHFYLQKKNGYDLNHGMWHLYGALITTFCIFTYAL